MKSLQWFRLYSEIVDDEKLGLLAFEDRWHFIALLACKAKGLIDQGDEFMRRKIARKLGLTMDEFDKAIERIARVKLIDKDTLEPLAWDRRQYLSDTSAERTRKYRERKAEGAQRHGDVTVTPPETDTESETETELLPDGSNTIGHPFEIFWSHYPRKVAKPAAERAWRKVKPDLEVVLADLRFRPMRGEWADPQFIPHPATYLNGRRWEDQPVERKPRQQVEAEARRRRVIETLRNTP